MSSCYNGGWAGPRSKFRVRIWFQVDESRSTDEAAFVQWGPCIQTSSDSNFGGTVVSTSWTGGESLTDQGDWYAWCGYWDCGLVRYGSSITKSAEAYYTGWSGTVYASSCQATFWPPTPTWQPRSVTNVSASRTKDSSLKVTWSNNKATARPYSGIYVDREVDKSGSFPLLSDCGGSKTSYTDTTTSANHIYRYRVLPHNGAGNASHHIYSDYVYTSPAPPTAIEAAQTAKTDTSVSITITTGNSASKVATKTYVQYRPQGGSWADVGKYDYKDKLSIKHNPGGGNWQYRARNFGHDLYSSWYSSAVVKVSVIQPPTSVSAINVKDSSGMVMNESVKVEIKANGASDDHPRTGFDMYIREVEGTVDDYGAFTGMTVGERSETALLSWKDSSASAIDSTKTIADWGSFSDMSGICRVFTVASYYSTAKSAETYSNRVYGRLIAPESFQVSKTGNVFSITCDAKANKYPYVIKYGFSLNSDKDTVEWFDYKPQENIFSLESSKYALADTIVQAKVSPDISGGLCEDMSSAAPYVSEAVSYLVRRSPLPVDSEKILVIGAGDDQAKYNKKIVFPMSVGDDGAEFATGYYVGVLKGGYQTYSEHITASNPEDGLYTAGPANMAWDESVQILIWTEYDYGEAVYYSTAAESYYKYEPLPLTAPQIVSIERQSANGNVYRVLFSPSTGGTPYVNEAYRQEGYKYTVYIDDDETKNQSPSKNTIICEAMSLATSAEYNYVDIPIISSKTVRVRMIGRDKRNVSQMSNSISVRYTIADVNIFVYGDSSVKIEDCILEGMANPLKVGGGAHISIENSTLRLPEAGGHYYDMDSVSEIFEVNNKYE